MYTSKLLVYTNTLKENRMILQTLLYIKLETSENTKPASISFKKIKLQANQIKLK
jgi:hypothetical protein